MNPLSTLKDIADARWPSAEIDAHILAGREGQDKRAVSLRAAYLVSPGYRRAIAGGLRCRPWVRDHRILDAYECVARRLESPEPVTACGMLRLRNLLRTAPSAVAVGSPDAVVRELGAINFLFDNAIATCPDARVSERPGRATTGGTRVPASAPATAARRARSGAPTPSEWLR